MENKKFRAYPFLFWMAALIAVPLEREVAKTVSPGTHGLTLESVRPAVIYSGGNKKDPFVSFLVPKSDTRFPTQPKPQAEPKHIKPPVVTLQGIIWGGRVNQAIINNSVVKVGDVIEGVLVTRIDKEGVTVRFGKEEYIITPSAGGTGVPKGKR